MQKGSSAFRTSNSALASMVQYLPTVNAALNAAATVLLVAGFVLIKRGRELAHKRAMLAAFVVSMMFLACYLAYHAQAGHVKFGGPEPVRSIYLAILGSHVLLAATVPFLAGATLYLGLRDRRAGHRRLAVWTFPIWLYVSVTGVVIYVMLYHLYPPASTSSTIEPAAAMARQEPAH
jgi:putative membrane protein